MSLRKIVADYAALFSKPLSGFMPLDPEYQD